MAIALSQNDYWELICESVAAEAAEPASDGFEWVHPFPARLGHGYVRTICLREGLELTIADYQCHEDICTYSADREHPLEYTFHLPEKTSSLTRATPYSLFGSGIAPGERGQVSVKQRIRRLSVHLEPEVFRSFTGNPDGEVPDTLQHLIGDPNQEYYVRPGRATPAMCIALWQILHCPYQGFTQRMFLEGKVWELMSLLLEQEADIHSGKKWFADLKPDDVDRLHLAKEVLRQNLDNPLSIGQLARQIGLNECTLKRGFRQVFNTTVFGYLRQFRMEQARVLLMQGHMNVNETAQAVGYASQSQFAAVFRKTFGVNPKTFSMQQWQ
ncbi:helix-turn-helix domain-containing protein [Synechococcales cyanobacterium C]|uniref:Helix-turn-helix domain-containing protein n=1 Tax=Petrachloros mirabilis ULC683 TaxID=2781853 RepID=A0A8K2A8C5_9CYAN|nr:AraC family transcriptional regulator [Petrachloros mirabilis]NCJ06830.1 helix-turn-helix domain-containing protein [Petrachloros mirabilis ULC683]